ncbi:FHA domain-containing protein [Chloroflexota bacterium]
MVEEKNYNDQIGSLETKLSLLEVRLQTVVESNVARLFPTGGNVNELTQKLVAALKLAIKRNKQGEILMPNLFELHTHHIQAQNWRTNPEFTNELTQILLNAGNEVGIVFENKPMVKIVSEKNYLPGEIRILAQYNSQNLPQTMGIETESVEFSDHIPANAFLIVDGTTIFPLTQAIINIGRREDNHLVIEDSRISRVHAQLKVNKGRFQIFDLGSTGGTQVNDKLINQCILYPGDVVSLAGVPVVYGQEESGGSETQDISIPSLNSRSSHNKSQFNNKAGK